MIGEKQGLVKMSVRINDSSYYVDTGGIDVNKFMEYSYNHNAQANEAYWREGTIDLRFKAGDQNLWHELYRDFPDFRRRRFNFNRLRRALNMVSGYQRQHRKATTAFPIEGSDELTADQFSKIFNWAYRRDNVYHTISDSFEGAITTGMNMLSIWMDYREDPINGDIRVNNLSYNSYILDTFFRKSDYSDANFFWTRKYISKDQAISLMPERRSEIIEMQGGSRDNKFTFTPENFDIKNPNLLSYDEFWYLDFRKQKLLVDPQSGETMEWRGSDENLNEFLRQFRRVKVQEIQKQTVKLATRINNRVMYDGPNPYKIDRYPFVPVLCYFEPDIPYYEWKIQGMIRDLRDAQYLYNRRKVIELDILESQVNSGLKVMEGSLVDDNDAFLSGQGRGVFIKKTAPLGMASVEQIPPPQVPPSMIQLSELLANEINQISGINEELLGSAEDDKAGILSMLRQGAGLTTLQKMFDNLDLSQKVLGELTMEMVQANFSPGKVRRILGEEPSPQFFNKMFQKFDCVVGEGVMTETQKRAAFATKFQLLQAGLPIPVEDVLDEANIPNKREMVEKIANQQQQATEQAQMQAQIEMAKTQAEIKAINASATANEGLGYERASRIEENRALAVERRAEAIKDLELASLDKVKAAKELQGIDLTQLQQLVNILNTIQSQDIAKAQVVEEVTKPQNIEMSGAN